MNTKTLAVFDFDGTMTYSDSFTSFLKFLVGKPTYIKGLAVLAPWLGAWKLKLLANDKAKEITMKHFFGGMPEDKFNERCRDFAMHKLPQLIRPDALAELNHHREQGHDVTLLSASPINYLGIWAEHARVDCLSTELEVADGCITGRIKGRNCYGAEKVAKLRTRYNPDDYTEIYAYGDTRGDRELLALATKPHYRHFHNA